MRLLQRLGYPPGVYPAEAVLDIGRKSMHPCATQPRAQGRVGLDRHSWLGQSGRVQDTLGWPLPTPRNVERAAAEMKFHKVCWVGKNYACIFNHQQLKLSRHKYAFNESCWISSLEPWILELTWIR